VTPEDVATAATQASTPLPATSDAGDVLVPRAAGSPRPHARVRQLEYERAVLLSHIEQLQERARRLERAAGGAGLDTEDTAGGGEGGGRGVSVDAAAGERDGAEEEDGEEEPPAPGIAEVGGAGPVAAARRALLRIANVVHATMQHADDVVRGLANGTGGDGAPPQRQDEALVEQRGHGPRRPPPLPEPPAAVAGLVQRMGERLEAALGDMDARVARALQRSGLGDGRDPDAIAFDGFAVGDIALFLPAGAPRPERPYVAFHVNCPHRFLSLESLDTFRRMRGREPEYVLGRVVYVEEKVSGPGDECYGLEYGTALFVLTVEALRQPTLSPRAVPGGKGGG